MKPSLPVVLEQLRPEPLPRGKVCVILPAVTGKPACVAMLDKIAEHMLLWLIDVETGDRVLFGDPQPGRMDRMRWLEDGRLLSATSRCGEGHAELRLWGMDGREPALLTRAPGMLLWLAPDAKRALLVDREGGVSLWDLEIAERVRRWETRLFKSKRWDPFVPSPVVSPQGDRVAMVRGARSVEVLNIERGDPEPLFEAPDELTRLLFHPGGDVLVTASFGPQVHVWDATSGTALAVLEGGEADVVSESLQISQDGRRLFAAYGDLSFRVWDLETMAGSTRLETPGDDGPEDVHGVTALVRFHPDGVHVLASHQNHVLHVWDRRSGAHVATWRGEDPLGTCACSGEDGSIWLGDIEGRVIVLGAPGAELAQEGRCDG